MGRGGARQMTIIEGLTFYVKDGRAYLTAQSYQKTDTSRWRPGTMMYNMAPEYRARATRILAGLNSGGYTTEKGMRYTIEKPGYIHDEAVSGEALETQRRIQAMGGLGEVDGISLGVLDFESGMEEPEEFGEMMGKINEIKEKIQQQIAEYREIVAGAKSRISYSLGEVFVG